MNKIQKRKSVFKKGVLAISCLMLSWAVQADPARLITQADSLFESGKYTESFQVYSDILGQGHYSPGMLLKMAYIQEGLGNVGNALYYLNLYYNETSNKQVLVKLEEMARENQLSGYESNDLDFFINLYHRFQYQVIGFLLAISFILLGLVIYQKRKNNHPYGAGVPYLFTLVLLFYLINFGDGLDQGIIVDQQTFLMTGPSAGADVVEIVERGHRVKILGREGIWLKIEWRDGEAYIRENKIRSLS